MQRFNLHILQIFAVKHSMVRHNVKTNVLFLVVICVARQILFYVELLGLNTIFDFSHRVRTHVDELLKNHSELFKDSIDYRKVVDAKIVSVDLDF